MLHDEQPHEAGLDDALAIQSTHHASIYGKMPPIPAKRCMDSPPIPETKPHSPEFFQPLQCLDFVAQSRMESVVPGWAAHMQPTSR